MFSCDVYECCGFSSVLQDMCSRFNDRFKSNAKMPGVTNLFLNHIYLDLLIFLPFFFWTTHFWQIEKTISYLLTLVAFRFFSMDTWTKWCRQMPRTRGHVSNPWNNNGAGGGNNNEWPFLVCLGISLNSDGPWSFSNIFRLLKWLFGGILHVQAHPLTGFDQKTPCGGKCIINDAWKQHCRQAQTPCHDWKKTRIANAWIRVLHLGRWFTYTLWPLVKHWGSQPPNKFDSCFDLMILPLNHWFLGRLKTEAYPKVDSWGW